MRDDLLLPGDIPGLLRRGSPVVDRAGAAGVVARMIEAVWGTQAVVAMRLEMYRHDLADLRLDVAYEAGRDRAVRWLAERVGLDASRGVLWYRVPGRWALRNGRSDQWYFPDAAVPALAEIDLTDPLADVRALVVVCLHVAGRE